MKDGYTKIAVVLDRSGSMESVKKATIDGFNEFLQGQKEVEGKASLTLAQFDDIYEIVYNNISIQDVSNLTTDTFRPRGMTALYDAVARTVDSIGKELSETEESERPEKVVFVILTDGQENASTEYSYEQMASKIAHQQDVYNWQFVFIGANQNAIATAESFNIPAVNAMSYTATPMSVGNTFKRVSANLSSYRSNVKSDMSYTEEDREEQEALDDK